MGKAVLRGVPGGLLHAHGVAVGTAVVDVRRHRPDKGPQAVVLPDNEGQADGGGVVLQGVPAGLVLLIGVDIGVVPKAHRLDALGPEAFHAVDTAGGAAGVQQQFHCVHLGERYFTTPPAGLQGGSRLRKTSTGPPLSTDSQGWTGYTFFIDTTYQGEGVKLWKSRQRWRTEP